ncbi:MAG: molybdenum cofactor guanylyltransferase [Cyanobacteriota bacterium]
MTPPPPLPLPLRGCLLSGGASRRMGRDKALLPHPEGDTWLERQLRLLAALGAPVTLLSGWPAHHERAAALGTPLPSRGVPLELLPEPLVSPDRPGGGKPAGPLVALARLMEAHPEEHLLLCPIDRPALTLHSLRALVAASSAEPAAIWIAAPDQPGVPPQPLVGLYPSDANRRRCLGEALARGERGLQRWLAGERTRLVTLPASDLANVNTPEEFRAWRDDAANLRGCGGRSAPTPLDR